MLKTFEIDDVSQEFNLTKSTLRYYENLGLITKVSKNSSGNREYSEENISEINFIVCMRKAGLTLRQIKEYIDLYAKGESTKDERLEILLAQKKEVIKNIEDLNNTLLYLNNKIDFYKKN